jgi:hypothetical protein
MLENHYLDYAGLTRFKENMDKTYGPIQSVRFVAVVEDIDHLPVLSSVRPGWMFNLTTGGLTTEDFVEGEGHIVADGENVMASELVTGYAQVTTVLATDDPRALGYYEVDTIYYNDVTATLVDGDNPSAKGLYEPDGSGGYTLTADTTVVTGKHYFEKATTYKLTADRHPVVGHTYYTQLTVLKWDLAGGIFDLENRYLEFGDTFPQKPTSRMIDGRTFLYMGDTKYKYDFIREPAGDPAEDGYYEGTFVSVPDSSIYVNPKQVPLYEKVENYYEVTPVGSENPSALGWYESNGATPPVFTLTVDTFVNTGKQYYTKGADSYARTNDATPNPVKVYYTATFAPSADVTVDPAKQYYSESQLYKKGAIYEYHTDVVDWTLETSGGAEVESIPLKDIDDLFI